MGMTETKETQAMNTKTAAGSTAANPDFRQLLPGRWMFNGCINGFGFPTREAAQVAHTITWQLRDMPRDERGKLSRADMRLSKTLLAQLEELAG